MSKKELKKWKNKLKLFGALHGENLKFMYSGNRTRRCEKCPSCKNLGNNNLDEILWIFNIDGELKIHSLTERRLRHYHTHGVCVEWIKYV